MRLLQPLVRRRRAQNAPSVFLVLLLYATPVNSCDSTPLNGECYSSVQCSLQYGDFAVCNHFHDGVCFCITRNELCGCQAQRDQEAAVFLTQAPRLTVRPALRPTLAPITAGPVSAAPISAAPISAARPVTSAPVTATPISATPVTAPITAVPTSKRPTTRAPTPTPTTLWFTEKPSTLWFTERPTLAPIRTPTAMPIFSPTPPTESLFTRLPSTKDPLTPFAFDRTTELQEKSVKEDGDSFLLLIVVGATASVVVGCLLFCLCAVWSGRCCVPVEKYANEDEEEVYKEKSETTVEAPTSPDEKDEGVEIYVGVMDDMSTLGDPIPPNCSPSIFQEQPTTAMSSLGFEFQKVHRQRLQEAKTPREKTFQIISPAGQLGLVLESDPHNGGNPRVCHVKPTSALQRVVQKGDQVLLLDGHDVTAMTAIELSQWIASQGPHVERTLLLCRTLDNNN